MKKSPPNKKGVAGVNTGAAARSSLRRLSGCMTNEEIGNRVNRSPSVISAIGTGAIKNPPKQLITALRSIKSCS